MRFKVCDRMLAALSGLLIIALGVAVALVGSGLLPAFDLSVVYGPFELWQRIIIVAVAVILLLLGLHGLHMLFRRRNDKGFIVQRTDMGDMSIAITALSNMVHKCVDQHQEITVKKIRINCVRGGITVDLKILLANGINIPLTVNVLQKQIKQYITSCSGVDVHEVRVQIGTTDKAVAAEVPALEQAPAMTALQDQSESAAENILRHTEEPADYVEPVEYTETAVEVPAEEVMVQEAAVMVEAVPVVEEAVETIATEMPVEVAEEVVVASLEATEELAGEYTYEAPVAEAAAEETVFVAQDVETTETAAE